MTEEAVVISQEVLAEGIFSLWLQTEAIAGQSVSGQFVTLYCRDRSRMLPRPISICEAQRENGKLRLVYRTAGEGTKEFSHLAPGDTVRVMGPLGKGYPELSRIAEKLPAADETGKEIRALLVGGGIGIPPLLQLARDLACRKTAVLGYRSEQFLLAEFEACADIAVATEDGSAGTRGTVLDAIRERNLQGDVILACGPKPMLRALKEYAQQQKMLCYVSLEERMACGIGACLACVCKTTDEDEHSRVHNTRICREGPVFDAGRILL